MEGESEEQHPGRRHENSSHARHEARDFRHDQIADILVEEVDRIGRATKQAGTAGAPKAGAAPAGGTSKPQNSLFS